MAAQELLKAALAAWSPVDLSATRHAALDKQGLEIADNQEQSAAGREVLKQKLQEFKKVPPEERPVRESASPAAAADRASSVRHHRSTG